MLCQRSLFSDGHVKFELLPSMIGPRLGIAHLQHEKKYLASQMTTPYAHTSLRWVKRRFCRHSGASHLTGSFSLSSC